MGAERRGVTATPTTETAVANHVDSGTTNRHARAVNQDCPGNDITKAFFDASQVLGQGQLVKDDFFTLFEAVGALEIMDPKMDSGASIPDQDAALEAFDPYSVKSGQQILWLMDQLFCAEMSWHTGLSLSQTILSSLHMCDILSHEQRPIAELHFTSYEKAGHAPDQPLVSIVLRAYCLALAKCCQFAIKEIEVEHYYEEEDFITATYTKDLLTLASIEDVLAVLDHAGDAVIAALSETQLRIALLGRLAMRRSLVQAFQPLTPCPTPVKPAYIMSILEMINELDATHCLAMRPETMLFSERTQRYLTSNTPPRPMRIEDWTTSVTILRGICLDVKAAFDIRLLGPRFEPDDVLALVWSFAYRESRPLTYARAVMQSNLFKDASILSTVKHRDFLLADLQAFMSLRSSLLDPKNWEVEIPSDPRFQTARMIDDIVGRVLDEYMNLYRMPLQNHCRIRRTFAQSIKILDSLQALAEDFDARLDLLLQPGTLDNTVPDTSVGTIESMPLSSWAYHLKLRAMATVVGLGFELELYLPSEMPACYAFLTFIHQCHHQHIAAVLACVDHDNVATTPARSKQRSQVSTLTAKRSSWRLTHLDNLSRCRALLASALADFYSVLCVLSLISPSHRESVPSMQAENVDSVTGSIGAEPPNNSDRMAQLQYDVRMRPFLGIGTPLLPTYDELQRATIKRSSTMTVVAMCDLADSKVRMVREETTRLRQVLKREKAHPSASPGRPLDGLGTDAEDLIDRDQGAEVTRLTKNAITLAVSIAAVRRVLQDVDSERTHLSAVTLGDLGWRDGRQTTSRHDIQPRLQRIREQLAVEIPDGGRIKLERGWAVPRVKQR